MITDAAFKRFRGFCRLGARIRSSWERPYYFTLPLRGNSPIHRRCGLGCWAADASLSLVVFHVCSAHAGGAVVLGRAKASLSTAARSFFAGGHSNVPPAGFSRGNPLLWRPLHMASGTAGAFTAWWYV